MNIFFYKTVPRVDQEVQNFPFWVDRMTRDDAEINLRNMPEGTFLLRWSDKHNQHIVSLR